MDRFAWWPTFLFHQLPKCLNIAFALGIKAVFLVLASTGHASLWMAILADTGATLLVILNPLRLLRLPARSAAG